MGKSRSEKRKEINEVSEIMGERQNAGEVIAAKNYDDERLVKESYKECTVVKSEIYFRDFDQT